MKRLCILMFVMILCMTGCGKNEELDTEKSGTEITAPEATMVYIYYPDKDRVAVADERYQLKQPDSTAASIEEIMANITKYIEDRLTYGIYMLDSENALTLEFTLTDEYDKEYYLLAKSAVSRTLFQLPDISEIKIVLYAGDKTVVSEEVLNRDSIYYYDEDVVD
ncbi:MAG: hypothetical protein IJV15_12125 [Lachnospiraceae bacterium]|nr:hypothetical protein [Lachnospiraceae bacterium]